MTITTTVKARDEFKNVSVTELAVSVTAGPEGPAHRGWLGVVDTRYGVSQHVASCRLNAGRLTVTVTVTVTDSLILYS